MCSKFTFYSTLLFLATVASGENDLNRSYGRKPLFGKFEANEKKEFKNEESKNLVLGDEIARGKQDGENITADDDWKTTAIKNTCDYGGVEYECKSISECDMNGGNSLSLCPNDLYCCVYRISSNYEDSGFTGFYHALQRLYLRHFFSLYDLPFFSWWRTSAATSQDENNNSNGGPDETTSQSQDPDSTDSLPTEDSGILNDDSTTLINDEIEEGDKLRKAYDRYSINHDCGEVLIRKKRIIGGRNSRFGHHPWQVALYKPTLKDKPYCGAALLTDKWIITAAHCVDDKPMKIITVRLGEYDVRRKDEKLRHEEFRVIKKVVHPDYADEGHRNDIALLKLDRRVHFDRHIIPICLPTKNFTLNYRRATVSGWGRRKDDVKTSGPAILNEVDVEIIPNDVCQKWFSEAGHERVIDDVFLCAGRRNGGSCKGDSGGPLTTSVKGREFLIGIVSWGFGCGRKHSPGVYTNIEKYVPWIIKVISN